MKSLLSRSWSVSLLAPLGVVFACSSSRVEQHRTASSAFSTGPGIHAFVKHGDNGTASCDDYCAGPQWGRTGTALGVQIENGPCNVAFGLQPAGMEQQCTCSDGAGTFVKDGDNGTADCNTYCAGPQWGRTGTCVASRLSTPNHAGGVSYAPNTSLTPGLLNSEMTCICAAGDLPFAIDDQGTIGVPAGDQSVAAGITRWTISPPWNGSGHTIVITGYGTSGRNRKLAITLPTAEGVGPLVFAIDDHMLAGSPSGLSANTLTADDANVWAMLKSDVGDIDIAQVNGCQVQLVLSAVAMVAGAAAAVSTALACPATAGVGCVLAPLALAYVESFLLAWGIQYSSCSPNTWGHGGGSSGGSSSGGTSSGGAPCDTSTCFSTCADSCGNPEPCNGSQCPDFDCTQHPVIGQCTHGACEYSNLCFPGCGDVGYPCGNNSDCCSDSCDFNTGVCQLNRP